MRPQLRECFLVMLLNLQGALLDPSGGGDEDQQQTRRRHRHDLDVAYHGMAERWILHDGDLLSDLGKQSHGAYQHVVEIERAGKKRLDSALLRGRKRLEGAESVDEQPITLVRRNTPGAGVRLHDVA